MRRDKKKIMFLSRANSDLVFSDFMVCKLYLKKHKGEVRVYCKYINYIFNGY